jgi:hypothetical protein
VKSHERDLAQQQHDLLFWFFYKIHCCSETSLKATVIFQSGDYSVLKKCYSKSENTEKPTQDRYSMETELTGPILIQEMDS